MLGVGCGSTNRTEVRASSSTESIHVRPKTATIVPVGSWREILTGKTADGTPWHALGSSATDGGACIAMYTGDADKEPALLQSASDRLIIHEGHVATCLRPLTGSRW